MDWRFDERVKSACRGSDRAELRRPGEEIRGNSVVEGHARHLLGLEIPDHWVVDEIERERRPGTRANIPHADRCFGEHSAENPVR